MEKRGELDHSLASLNEVVRILGESREQWGRAAEIIRKVDSGLADRQLGQYFFKARPVREILAK